MADPVAKAALRGEIEGEKKWERKDKVNEGEEERRRKRGLEWEMARGERGEGRGVEVDE